jgi:hypothetical protein
VLVVTVAVVVVVVDTVVVVVDAVEVVVVVREVVVVVSVEVVVMQAISHMILHLSLASSPAEVARSQAGFRIVVPQLSSSDTVVPSASMQLPCTYVVIAGVVVVVVKVVVEVVVHVPHVTGHCT